MRKLTTMECQEVNGRCGLDIHNNPNLTPEQIAEICAELSGQPDGSAQGTASVAGTEGNRSTASNIR